MKGPSFLASLLLAGGCALAPTAARATLFCVANGNTLANAIGLSEFNNADDEIRIVSGHIGLPASFDPGEPIWAYEPWESDLDNGLAISGGWTGTDVNCGTQTGLPEDTVLATDSYGSALYFRAKKNFALGADQTLRGQIAVRNLSIINAIAYKNSGDNQQSANASAIEYSGLTEHAGFTVERVIVRDNAIGESSSSLIAINVHGTGTFKLIGNAIFDNSLYGTTGGSAMSLDCQGGALCYVNNNSIYDNQAAGSNPVYPGMRLGGLVAAANNVVANNTFLSGATVAQAGPLGSAAQLDLRHNHFQSDAFVGTGYEIHTRNGDAQWTRSGLYRIPNAGSPLRNNGRNNPFGGVGSLDIVGNPRIREATVDRGAYERINLAPTLSAPSNVVISSVLGVSGIAYATSVIDPDGNDQALAYSLTFQSCTPAVADKLFHIAADGKVRLSTGVPLGTTSCLVVAKVADGALSTEVSTTVKINRPPQLDDASMSLPASTAVGSLVRQFAASDDGQPTSTLSYSLIAAQGPNTAFALASNGKLTLTAPLPQQGATYTLVVKACDAMPLCDNGSLVVTVGAGSAQPQGDIFSDGFD